MEQVFPSNQVTKIQISEQKHLSDGLRKRITSLNQHDELQLATSSIVSKTSKQRHAPRNNGSNEKSI